MSEPIRTTPAQRAKLAAALKRNMARRKGVASRQSSVTSEANSKRSGEQCVAEGEPRNGRGQRSIGDTRSVAKRGEANVPFNHKGDSQ